MAQLHEDDELYNCPASGVNVNEPRTISAGHCVEMSELRLL